MSCQALDRICFEQVRDDETAVGEVGEDRLRLQEAGTAQGGVFGCGEKSFRGTAPQQMEPALPANSARGRRPRCPELEKGSSDSLLPVRTGLRARTTRLRRRNWRTRADHSVLPPRASPVTCAKCFMSTATRLPNIRISRSCRFASDYSPQSLQRQSLIVRGLCPGERAVRAVNVPTGALDAAWEMDHHLVPGGVLSVGSRHASVRLAVSQAEYLRTCNPGWGADDPDVNALP
jgi:hypothetical protein